MKYIFLTLIFVSNFAFAQAKEDVNYTPPAQELNENTQDTVVKPTPMQKKHVKAPAKKKAQKSSHKKHKTAKKTKKHSKVNKNKKNKKATK